MGHDHSRLHYSVSAPNIPPPASPAPCEDSKRISIQIASTELTVTLTDHSLTFGWLLSEAIRHYKGKGTLVALRTEAEQDVIDVRLLTMSSLCTVLRDGERLVGVLSGMT